MDIKTPNVLTEPQQRLVNLMQAGELLTGNEYLVTNFLPPRGCVGENTVLALLRRGVIVEAFREPGADGVTNVTYKLS